VRVATFQSHTARDLKNAIDSLKKENKQPLQGLVLDLRNNPGGVLNAAAEVSDLFLDDGLIVFTRGRVKDAYFEFKAHSGDILADAPMVVLINGGSASASEIVAGALQDHKRAVLMGEKSFGKGSVQTIQELRNGGAVKFTTARYFTPSGRSIQAEGIVPDIELQKLQLTAVKDNGLKSIKEADLSGHLLNPVNGDSPPGDMPGNDNGADALTDYQVNEALNLLKGLSIFREMKKS
jgi:carboxyl-terminal processing protease